jgi:hypothetical protein
MEVSGQLHASVALPIGLEGCVGPRAVLDAVVKRKIPIPCRESNPGTPIVQPVAQRYTDWASTALILRKVGFIFWLYEQELSETHNFSLGPPYQILLKVI